MADQTHPVRPARPAGEAGGRRSARRPSGIAGWLQGAALLGAIAVIAGAWDWLMARPSIGLEMPGQINLLTGAAGSVEASVINQGEAQTRVSLAGDLPGIVVDPGILSLGARERATLRIGVAAAPEPERTLQLTATARAGRLRGHELVARPLRVVTWQPVQATPVLLLRLEPPLKAQLQASIGTGVPFPGGLRCLAVARLPASATFTGVSPADTYDDPNRNSEHANETVSMAWLVPATNAFEQTTHTLFMESREAWDAPRWEALASRTSVTCERR